jgi:hypothetical protein
VSPVSPAPAASPASAASTASAAAAAGRPAAASYLRELLLRPGRYRRIWEQHAIRVRLGEINQLAVAEALARHLWNYPRDGGDADVVAHQLKDTVSRSLNGRLLSRRALSLFIDVFGFSDQEQGRLWRLWEGSAAISVLTGDRAMPSDSFAEVAAVLGPRRHQTLSLHDHVYVGFDGRVASTRTLQVVEAIADGLDRIPYIYDTNATTLETGQGCGEPAGSPYRISEGVYATDIPLIKSLALGETLTLEYWTSYHYPGNFLDPRECQFRRAALRRLDNLDLRVEFHPGRLPEAVWWAVWDGLDGEIAEQQPVTLDGQHSVHRYLRSLDNAVVGFHWSWPDAGS